MITMERILVGSKDCPIQKTVLILSESAVMSNGWQKLAICLETPLTEIDTLKSEKSVIFRLTNILQEWIQRRSKEATLVSLLNSLRKCEYNELADRIETEFPCDTSTEEKAFESDLGFYLEYRFVTLVDKTKLTNEIIEKLKLQRILEPDEAKILKEIADLQDQSCFFWKLMKKCVTENEKAYETLIQLFKNDADNHRNGVTRILDEYYLYCNK